MQDETQLDDWTFNGASTRDYTHIYHDYPARMIPQVARKIVRLYGQSSNKLFDPYCGTGSSLVEGIVEGLDVMGTDINPLARLIATGKTDYSIEPESVSALIAELESVIYNNTLEPTIPDIKGIDFWFKEGVIPKLGRIRAFVDNIENQNLKRFFQIAFSETVRESSNTRKNEFKLYRYDKKKLEIHAPDPYKIMLTKLERNKLGLIHFRKIIGRFEKRPTSTVLDLDSVSQIPSRKVKSSSVDIVVTSPPYGDSHTTVAYGQYSRLSSEWLSLISSDNIDSKLMGGYRMKEIPDFPSDALNKAIEIVSERNHKRALEVSSFYYDLWKSISNVSKLIMPNGHSCYVVGNRTVSSVILPTSDAVKDFFQEAGMEYVATHIRDIPNKRMPSRNSPTNVSGETSSTMLNEHIVIMRKR